MLRLTISKTLRVSIHLKTNIQVLALEIKSRGDIIAENDVRAQYLRAVHAVYASNVLLSSDERLKENINTLENSLEKLMSLRGVSYYWKDKTTSEDLQIGVIAQEIERIFPDLVTTNGAYKAVNYIGLVPVMLEAIKEQQTQIEASQAVINSLKASLLQIEEALDMK